MQRPNQSLERTPLGLPVCMGLPCMVSLSSGRSAMIKKITTLAIIILLLDNLTAQEDAIEVKYNNFSDKITNGFVYSCIDHKEYGTNGATWNRYFWHPKNNSNTHLLIHTDERDRVAEVNYFFELPYKGPKTEDYTVMRDLMKILCPKWNDGDKALKDMLEDIRTKHVKKTSEGYNTEWKDYEIYMYLSNSGEPDFDDVMFSIINHKIQ